MFRGYRGATVGGRYSWHTRTPIKVNYDKVHWNTESVMYKKGDLSRPVGRGFGGGGGSDSAAPPGRPLGVVSTGRHDRWHHRLSDRPPRFVTPHLARTSNSNKLECFKTALTDFEHTPRRRCRIANVTVGSGADFFQSRCGSCLVRMIREFVRWKVI